MYRLNLSVNRELVRIAKMEAARKDMTLSSLVEESLTKNIKREKIIESVKKYEL